MTLALAFGCFAPSVRIRFQDLPADLFHRRAAAVVAVNNSRSIGFLGSDGGDQTGDGPDVILMPRHQQPTTNQIVNFSLIAGQRTAYRQSGGNDSVMVRDLVIIHEARSQRPLASAGRQPIMKRLRDSRDHRPQRSRDCRR